MAGGNAICTPESRKIQLPVGAGRDIPIVSLRLMTVETKIDPKSGEENDTWLIFPPVPNHRYYAESSIERCSVTSGSAPGIVKLAVASLEIYSALSYTLSVVSLAFPPLLFPISLGIPFKQWCVDWILNRYIPHSLSHPHP